MWLSRTRLRGTPHRRRSKRQPSYHLLAFFRQKMVSIAGRRANQGPGQAARIRSSLGWRRLFFLTAVRGLRLCLRLASSSRGFVGLAHFYGEKSFRRRRFAFFELMGGPM